MEKTALLWISFLLLLACQPKKNKEGVVDEHNHKVYYSCSMDPQVRETQPGNCPICHMELTPITLDQLQVNGLKLSDAQVQLGNIQTEQVKMDYVEKHLTVTGTVRENQNNSHSLNARIGGRIEKWFVKTEGAVVRKGQVLGLLYSEQLAATQSEFIENQKLLAQKPRDYLLLSIREKMIQKLLLWGVTNSQIAQLTQSARPPVPFPVLSPVSGVVTSIRMTEGGTVREGTPLLELTTYSSVWVEAQFYAEETQEIRPGDKVEVNVEGNPKITVQGTVVQVLPQVSPSSVVNLVRISVSAKEENVLPGMQATVRWSEAGKKALMVPSHALLKEEKATIAWIKNKEDIFVPKMVHTGKVAGKRTEILHGLSEGDEVVISGAYLLQSEYVLKKGANKMAGHPL